MKAKHIKVPYGGGTVCVHFRDDKVVAGQEGKRTKYVLGMRKVVDAVLTQGIRTTRRVG